MLHTGFKDPQYHGVVMLRMPRFDGKRLKSWSQLDYDHISQVFKIVKSFHKVSKYSITM